MIKQGLRCALGFCASVTLFCLIVFLLISHGYALRCSVQDLNAMGYTDEEFGLPVRFTSANLSASIGNEQVPIHCSIHGTIWPEIGFSMKLPLEWNGKIVVVGCGGACGFINESAMVPYLKEGFAVAADDSGHKGSVIDWSFAYNPPDNSNPYAEQKLKDHGYRSIHETTSLLKKIITAFYGQPARFAYYVGASTGGRQGLKNLQLYQDFDGYLIGMPVLEITGNAMMDVWKAKNILLTFPSDQRLLRAKMDLLAQRVYEKCDEVDGVRDGLIVDPRLCSFDPSKDLPICGPGQDPATCFTEREIQALKDVYEGPRNPVTGERLFFGHPVSGEPQLGLVTGAQLGLALGGGFQKFVVKKDPSWNPFSYDFSSDPYLSRSSELRRILDAVDPNLSPALSRGVKVIHWHGWADTLVTPWQSIDYYEKVRAEMGDATERFYKLYMIPGWGHGSGFGIFPENFFTLLTDWVEKGIEPEAVIGTRGQESRLFCPYPKVAIYKGGDPNKAESYRCEFPHKKANYTYVVPRLQSGWNWEGFSILNLNSAEATVFVTAYKANGEPVQELFGPQKLGSGVKEVFLVDKSKGIGLEDISYYTISSDMPLLIAYGSGYGSENAFILSPERTLASGCLILPELQEQAIVCKSSEGCNVSTEAFDNEGSLRYRMEVTVGANKLLKNPIPLKEGWARLSASGELNAFSAWYRNGWLKADAIEAFSGTLRKYYLPHLACDDLWTSVLVLINLSDSTNQLRATLTGASSITTAEIDLMPYQKKALKITELFPTLSKEEISKGALILEGNSNFVGFISYETAGGMVSIPLIENLASSLVVPHVADDRTWWTGMALFNPGEEEAQVTVKAFNSQGTEMSQTRLSIPPLSKKAFLVKDLLGQGVSYLVVNSTKPIAGLYVIGDPSNCVLMGGRIPFLQ